MTKKSNANIDFDRAWALLSRSVAAKNEIEKVCKDLVDEIKNNAISDAYDTGKYEQSIKFDIVGAQEGRRALKAKNNLRTRTRQGVVGKNKFIDIEFKGDPEGGAYDGSVGFVISTSPKSTLIEFGSLARKASFVFTKAATTIAQNGVTFEKIFEGKENAVNLEELGAKISRGRKNATKKREGS